MVQSPIALNTKVVDLKDDAAPLEYHGHWDAIGTAKIQNVGISAMITFSKRPEQPYITGGPLNNEKYIFEQLHFHWADNDNSGCEHTVEGSRYSMEAHAVHYNSKYNNFQEAVNKTDGLAVTGFFIQAMGDTDCPEFKKITDGIQRIGEPNSKSVIDSDCLSWMHLQELSKHYYTYKGSLTTPPYYESVTWIVYRTPIFVSRQQIAIFRNLCSSPEDTTKKILNNYREIQEPKKQPQIVFTRNVQKLKSKL